jgi:hypothetical protein
MRRERSLKGCAQLLYRMLRKKKDRYTACDIPKYLGISVQRRLHLRDPALQ